MAASDEIASDEELLTKAVAEWEAAQILFAGPAWNGQPMARHLAELIGDRPSLEPKLVQLLGHESQLVSAYSLLTLDLMDSRFVEHLPGNVFGRREKITTLMGSFSDKMELGAFARHIAKRWRKRHES
jgi:hypothetical protein